MHKLVLVAVALISLSETANSIPPPPPSVSLNNQQIEAVASYAANEIGEDVEFISILASGDKKHPAIMLRSERIGVSPVLSKEFILRCNLSVHTMKISCSKAKVYKYYRVEKYNLSVVILDEDISKLFVDRVLEMAFASASAGNKHIALDEFYKIEAIGVGRASRYFLRVASPDKSVIHSIGFNTEGTTTNLRLVFVDNRQWSLYP